jgi:hypothetical protein
MRTFGVVIAIALATIGAVVCLLPIILEIWRRL